MSACEGVMLLSFIEAFGFVTFITGEIDLTPFLRTGWLCGLDVDRLLEVDGAFGNVEPIAVGTARSSPDTSKLSSGECFEIGIPSPLETDSNLSSSVAGAALISRCPVICRSGVFSIDDASDMLEMLIGVGGSAIA